MKYNPGKLTPFNRFLGKKTHCYFEKNCGLFVYMYIYIYACVCLFPRISMTGIRRSFVENNLYLCKDFFK